MSASSLVIRFGSLGDLVLVSAPILNLRLNDPEARITLLTKERFRPIAEMMPGLDSVTTVADRTSAFGLYNALLEIDANRYESVIDLHGNLRSWFARALITSSARTVYPKRRLERWRATRRRKSLPSEYPHTIDLYNRALVRLGVPTPATRPLLQSPDLSDEYASAVSFDGEKVLIAPGAAHPNKAWPVEQFAAAAVALRKERGCRLIWAVASEGRGRQTAALSVLPEDTVHLVDCPIDQLAAVIKECDLAIANDSGVGHVASAVGTPLISIFGPTHPVLGFAPRGLHDRIIQTEQFCRPCSRHGKTPCYRDQRYCFTEIKTEEVVRAANETIDFTSKLRPAIFVDRDGTLIANRHYLSDPAKVELIPGAAGALREAHRSGYKVIVLSNQSGVARGYHNEDDVISVNKRMTELLTAVGARVDDIYYCPHYPGLGESSDEPCGCRKPSAGMAERAALEHKIDLRRSHVIGDSLVDTGLAAVVGATPILVRTGYGTEIEARYQRSLVRAGVIIADDLRQAVNHRVVRTGI